MNAALNVAFGFALGYGIKTLIEYRQDVEIAASLIAECRTEMEAALPGLRAAADGDAKRYEEELSSLIYGNKLNAVMRTHYSHAENVN